MTFEEFEKFAAAPGEAECSFRRGFLHGAWKAAGFYERGARMDEMAEWLDSVQAWRDRGTTEHVDGMFTPPDPRMVRASPVDIGTVEDVGHAWATVEKVFDDVTSHNNIGVRVREFAHGVMGARELRMMAAFLNRAAHWIERRHDEG